MARYDVYMYNVPVVSDEGKSVPIPPHRTQECSEAEEAGKLAAEQKDKFDRVVVIETSDDKQRMVERYVEGQHEVPEKKEEKAEEAEADEAQEAEKKGEEGNEEE